MRAVVDEVDDEVIIARLDSQAPEIDGVVIVERPKAKAHGSSDGKRVQKPALPSGKTAQACNRPSFARQCD